MPTRLILSAVLVLGTGGVALAGHANPWTEDTSILNMQYHDENLVQSLATPGEDEMLGEMVQVAHGKLAETGEPGTDAPRGGGRAN